jgi:hypothetical protein
MPVHSEQDDCSFACWAALATAGFWGRAIGAGSTQAHRIVDSIPPERRAVARCWCLEANGLDRSADELWSKKGERDGHVDIAQRR